MRSQPRNNFSCGSLHVDVTVIFDFGSSTKDRQQRVTTDFKFRTRNKEDEHLLTIPASASSASTMIQDLIQNHREWKSLVTEHVFFFEDVLGNPSQIVIPFALTDDEIAFVFSVFVFRKFPFPEGVYRDWETG